MKGKYAARAATRRSAADAEATEEAYKRAVVRLTKERDEARAERDKAIADGQKEARILRAQLAEGTSPRVEALTVEANRLRGERDKIARTYKEAREKWHAASARLRGHMEVEHGLSPVAASEATMQIITGQDRLIAHMGTDRRVLEAFGEEALMALRKARGT